MKQILAEIFILVCGFLIGYYVRSQKGTDQSANQMDVEEIAKINFNKWLRTLATKNSVYVAELYHDEASFHPTQHGKLQKGQSGAEEYFVHFLEKNPVGKLVESHVQILTNWLYLHSGLYDFTIASDEKKEVVEARFTFVWILKNGDWKILHHHSSVKPV